MVGRDIYSKLIRGYTEKQWGRPCDQLPAFIIRRLPVRFTWDCNYFNDRYQGIPADGYTRMVERMLEGIEVCLNTDYLADKTAWNAQTRHVIYTGQIDAYFDYCLGELHYRMVRYETELLKEQDHQGNAVVNYTDRETPWIRVIEHKWFDSEHAPKDYSIVSREYSHEWHRGDYPSYPINDEVNNELYRRYQALAQAELKVTFGGRLGEYRYYDMDTVIARAMAKFREIQEGK